MVRSARELLCEGAACSNYSDAEQVTFGFKNAENVTWSLRVKCIIYVSSSFASNPHTPNLWEKCVAKIVAAAFHAGAAFTLFETVSLSWARQMESCLRRHNSNTLLHKQEEQVEGFYHRGGVRTILCTHTKVGGSTESFGRYHGNNICRVIYYVTDVVIHIWKHPLDGISFMQRQADTLISKCQLTSHRHRERATILRELSSLVEQSP